MFTEANACVYRMLVRRDHSIKEVTTRLKERGSPAEVIDASVEEAVVVGYLSVARFTSAFVRSKKSCCQGPRKIQDAFDLIA